MSIGAVVIGRNEAQHLRHLADCLRAFPFDEIVYVDSNSSDASVAIARAAGWRVVTLLPAGVISAAAGRHVGTLFCQTDWILYLDADILPNLSVIAQWIAYLEKCDPTVVGLTGYITDVFDSTRRDHARLHHVRHGEQALWFAIVVLLKRQAVLAAGNWNPNVIAEEEWDLDARLRKRNGRVIYFHGEAARHFTDYAPSWLVILRFLSLWDCANPRNGSAGYVLRSAFEAGSFWQAFTVRPEFFIVPLGTLMLAALGWFWDWRSMVAGFLLLYVWVTVRRGPRYFALCYVGVVQMVVGLFRYRKNVVCYRVLDTSAPQ